MVMKEEARAERRKEAVMGKAARGGGGVAMAASPPGAAPGRPYGKGGTLVRSVIYSAAQATLVEMCVTSNIRRPE